MALSGSDRRRLRGEARALKCAISVGRAGVTDALVTELRGRLERDGLVKVRFAAKNGTEADAAAGEIVGRVPCELVGRTGFVATFYCEPVKQQGADDSDGAAGGS
jgi:RNA-binding protein YhbY